MTDTDARDVETCPICGSILVARGDSLYCASCDLTYEAGEHHDGENGSTPPE